MTELNWLGFEEYRIKTSKFYKVNSVYNEISYAQSRLFHLHHNFTYVK